MARLAFWNRIPDGSTLEFSMNPAVGNFDVSIATLRDDGQTGTFTHQQIASGAAHITLTRPRIYTANFTIRFIGAQNSTVTIMAQVVKPEGGVHGTPFSEAITGNNGRVETAAVLAVTRK